MSEPLVYLNGNLIPASRANIAIYDMGIIQGATVTERLRTFNKEPFQVDAHLERLDQSLHHVRLDIGISIDSLKHIIHELVNHNSKLVHPDDELNLVIFVTAGENSKFAAGSVSDFPSKPTICVHTFRAHFGAWATPMQEGQHLVTPPTRHVPPQCYNPAIKNRSRFHFYMADMEARDSDPDASALLLDIEGNITETSYANFLLFRNGSMISPTLRNILPGVSRKITIDLAAELGIPLLESDLQTSEAIEAEEAFLTSTSFCLMPVTRINGSPIGTGKPGQVYQKLLGAWNRRAGLDIHRQITEGARRHRQEV